MRASAPAHGSKWPLASYVAVAAGYAALALVAFLNNPPRRSGPGERLRSAQARMSYGGRAALAPPAKHEHETETDSHESGRSKRVGWWAMVRDAGSQWVNHKDARLGAALSYYSVFSIGPILLIAVAIAGFFFGEDAVRGQVSETLRSFLGDTGAKAVEGMLAGANQRGQGIVATVVGIGTLIFAAIGVVVQLKDALNTVWEVDPPPSRGIWGFVRSYVLSFAGVLALGFLLMVSMLVTAALSALGKFITPYVPEALLQVVNIAISLCVISVLFGMMFKWLPDAKIAWRDVWFGAVATAVLFEIGKFLIGLYIGKQGLESTYGAAASVVVVLIWVYYSAQIVLLGAELTNVHAKAHGWRKPRAQTAS
jgi:membrane protein